MALLNLLWLCHVERTTVERVSKRITYTKLEDDEIVQGSVDLKEIKDVWVLLIARHKLGIGRMEGNSEVG